MSVAGVDEAGRGALAGPVVVAAVILREGQDTTQYRDSKLLSPSKREQLYEHIKTHSLAVGIGLMHAPVIDRINILQANFLAMRAAVMRLGDAVGEVWVDGNMIIPGLELPQTAIISGDALHPVISAASIIAKVVRDRIMRAYDRIYPEYGFIKHKGYGTAEHMLLLDQVGLCPLHRRTFCKFIEQKLF